MRGHFSKLNFIRDCITRRCCSYVWTDFASILFELVRRQLWCLQLHYRCACRRHNVLHLESTGENRNVALALHPHFASEDSRTSRGTSTRTNVPLAVTSKYISGTCAPDGGHHRLLFSSTFSTLSVLPLLLSIQIQRGQNLLKNSHIT